MKILMGTTMNNEYGSTMMKTSSLIENHTKSSFLQCLSNKDFTFLDSGHLRRNAASLLQQAKPFVNIEVLQLLVTKEHNKTMPL